VTGVEARGKHLLVHFDDGATLHTHMMLDGVWHVYRARARWRRAAYRARVVLQVDDGTTAVCFDAPVVELRREGRAHPPSRATESLDRLGPDLCGDAPDLDAVLDRLATIPAETMIGEALLDQRAAAGIGNVFKSEICWARRVHPSTHVGAPTRGAAGAVRHRTRSYANLGSGRRAPMAAASPYGKQRRPCPLSYADPARLDRKRAARDVLVFALSARARTRYIVRSAPNGASTSRSRPVSFAE
jgi:endonuclease-8